jgi:hypothetical protein
MIRRAAFALVFAILVGAVECQTATTRTSRLDGAHSGRNEPVRLTVSSDEKWSSSSLNRPRRQSAVAGTRHAWKTTPPQSAERSLEDGEPNWDDMGYGWDDSYSYDGVISDNNDDDDAANWCSPYDAYKHYGDHYHLHQGNFQKTFGGYSCRCASMSNRMIGFDCTSCVACEDSICTMRNVTLRTEYTDPRVEQGETLYVCTKFVNDFRPYRQVEICGIVHSPDSSWDDSTLTTVNYSVNGQVCASTERIACDKGNETTGFRIDCSNAGYKRAMNTCTGSGLTGPWWFLYKTSQERSNGRVKVNPFLTVGVSLTATAVTSQCPYYDDTTFSMNSPNARWVIPQVMTFASIVAIGTLYRTLS